MKTVTVKNIYDDYALYQVLYGRCGESHAFSAYAAAYCIEQFAKKNPWIEKEGLHVVEPLAGHNEHEQYFREATGLPIKKYYPIDLHPDFEKYGVHIGDATTMKYPKCNVVINFYFGIDTICSTFEEVVTYMTNIRKNLQRNKKGGIFVLHREATGYKNCFESIKASEVVNLDIELSSNLMLYKDLKLSCEDKAFMRITILHEYNRWTCRNTERIKKAQVYVNKKFVKEYIIENPLVFRYWSEPEYCEALRLSGFSDAMFIKANIDGNSINSEAFVIPKIVRNSQLELVDNLDNLMPNFIVGIVKGEK